MPAVSRWNSRFETRDTQMGELAAFESRLRRLLSQAGEWVEARLGRERKTPDHRQLASQITPKLHEAIDRAAQRLEGSEQLWVSGDIAVLLDYNTFAQLDPLSLNALADELREVAADAIANRQYETDSIAVRVSYDPLLAQPVVRVAAADPQRVSLFEPSPAEPESAIATGAMAYVLASLSPELSVQFALPAPRKKRTIVSIGRSADNTLVADHASISKFHATLGIDPDGTVAIADVGSSNGTFVNRQRVKGRTSIHPGDVVTLGEIDFRLEQR